MYIKSNQVDIFPTSMRNWKIDNNSRLNTEQNITELTNRLVGNQSYIVSGLDVKEENNEIIISAGVCVINGYKFELAEQTLNEQSWNKIYLEIRLQDIIVSTGTTEYKFKELVKDDTNTFDTNTLDIDNGGTLVFQGLQINTTPTLDYYSLLIKEKVDNKWIKPTSSEIITKNPIYIDDGTIS